MYILYFSTFARLKKINQATKKFEIYTWCPLFVSDLECCLNHAESGAGICFGYTSLQKRATFSISDADVISFYRLRIHLPPICALENSDYGLEQKPIYLNKQA